MPPRLSLTAAQIRAGVGAELLSLCQTVTADGVLTDPEVTALSGWLAANSTSDLPAIGFLVTTLQRILADGRITPEERAELYAAIEKVLPPEARQTAKDNRKAVEAAIKELAKERREAERTAEREARERDRALYTVNFMVAGVSYEGRPAIIRRYVQEDDRAFLARDPANRFSRNAIEVRTAQGYCYGYVPEDYAPEVAPLLDQGVPHVAHVPKVLRGGRVPIPIVQASLHRTDAQIEGLTFPNQVPPRIEFVNPTRASHPEDDKDDWQAVASTGSRGNQPKVSSSRFGCAVTLVVLVALLIRMAR